MYNGPEDSGEAIKKVLTDSGEIWYHKNRTVYYNKTLKLHREDGPAREWHNGRKEYWLNGAELQEIKSTEELIIKLIIE
jgi:hypothetical protein